MQQGPVTDSGCDLLGAIAGERAFRTQATLLGKLGRGRPNPEVFCNDPPWARYVAEIQSRIAAAFSRRRWLVVGDSLSQGFAHSACAFPQAPNCDSWA